MIYHSFFIYIIIKIIYNFYRNVVIKIKIIVFLLLFLLSGCSIININDLGPNTIDIENGTKYSFSDNLKYNGPLTTNLCPSVGNVKLLTFVVSFDDSDYSNILNDVNLAFNASDTTLGYYSVNSYYLTSSYNKLNLNSDIFGVYKAKYNPSYYEYYKNEEGSLILLREILTYYDEVIDYNDYDSDKDGYIDGIWLIYTKSVDYFDSDFWWAYTSIFADTYTYDGLKVSTYAFAGSDFMYDKNYVSYDPTNIVIDAHTYIHETAHMMGVDDYYDYNKAVGANCSTYGIDMMDETYGDHGPVTKLLLGWINPNIVIDDYKAVVNSFSENGEALLVTNKFKGTIYDSYLLIIYYTNDKINFYDHPLNSSGVLIYEINAEKNLWYDEVIPNGGNYITGFKYDNSDTILPFVNIVSKNENIFTTSSKEDKILFKKCDTYNNYNIDFSVNVLYNNSSNSEIEIVFN